LVTYTSLPTSSALSITIKTGKASYQIGEDIYVYGNLTYDGSPVQDRLVAIEVQNPNNETVVSRTRQTDTDGKYNLTFKLPTDAKLGTYTVYVSSIYRGETATNNTVFELTPIRDIAVVKVTPSKTVVGQGYSANISVTITNEGYVTETFNVTAYYNDTAIILPDGKNHTTTILPSGDSTTLTLTWNTTGVAKGNHTITAEATQLPGETDTTDNTLTNGWIIVAMPGDITGPDGWPDGKVDMRDVYPVARGFGAEHITDSNDPRYCEYWHKTPCASCPHTPNADITGILPGVPDGKIDMRDIYVVARNFGKTDP